MKKLSKKLLKILSKILPILFIGTFASYIILHFYSKNNFYPVKYPENYEISNNTHPHLLFSESDVSNIQNRINKGGVVQKVFNNMKYWPNINATNPHLWSKELIDNSFYYAISKDETAKNIALSIYNKYYASSSPDRYNFNLDPNNKNSTIAQHCNALTLAYDLLYPALTESQRNDGKNLLMSWANGFYNLYKPLFDQWAVDTTHTFHSGSIQCVGLIGMTLWGEIPQETSDKWISFSKAATMSPSHNYFNNRFNPGGDNREGPLYQYYGSGPAIIYAIAYQRHFGEDLLTDTNATNMWDYFVYSLMPDKKYVRYGDNYNTALNGENFYVLKNKIIQNDPRIPAYLWVWQQIRGINGDQIDYNFLWKVFDRMGIVMYYPQDITAKTPDEIPYYKTTKLIPSSVEHYQQEQGAPPNDNLLGGMVSLRTGWSDIKNITLWLINRWGWQSHQYYDPNHFLMYAYGQKLITHENNSGYEDSMRGQISWHNTILIDKNNGDCPPNSNIASSALGMIKDLYSSDVADMVLSDSKYPHVCFGTQNLPFYGAANFTNVKPIKQADRGIILVKQGLDLPYVVINDSFNKNDAIHTYTWQGFFPASATNISGDATPESPFHFVVNGIGLMTSFITPNSFTTTVIPKSDTRDDKALQITQTNVIKGDFLTILFPYNYNKPSLTIKKLNSNNPIVSSIVFNGKENIIIANNNEETVNFEEYTTDARLAIIGKENGILTSYIVQNSTTFRADGITLFSSPQRASKAERIGSSTYIDLNSDGKVNEMDLMLVLMNWYQYGMNKLVEILRNWRN